MGVTGDVFPNLWEVAGRQDGVVTAEQVHAAGVPRKEVRRILRSRRWQSLARGSYWVAADGNGPRLRTRVQAALLNSGPSVVAEGPPAARLHGIEGLPPDDGVIHLAAPRPGRGRPGVVCRRLHGRDIRALRDLAVTTPAQTVADLLLALERVPALSVLDSALHQRLLPGGADQLLPYLAERPGAKRVRRWLPESDGRAESPLETRLRLVCSDAGMPPEVLQWSRDDPLTGRRYRIDLGWPSAGVGAEADGRAVHGRPEALYADRTRQNALLAANPGLVLLRFTWADAYDPDDFLLRLHQALVRG